MSKKIEIIENKIGLSRSVAEKLYSLSKKHCIWMANEYVAQEYKITLDEFQVILNWVKEESEHNLTKLSFKEAHNLATEYFSKHKKTSSFKSSNNSLKNKTVYLDLGYYKWVKLISNKDCKEEGKAMNHCLSSSSTYTRHFSLRDIYNFPHITLDIEYIGDARIKNVFGKGNSVIKDSYIPYLASFMEYNNSWDEFLPRHAGEISTNSISKVLVYAIENEMYNLVNKIIKKTNYYTKELIEHNLRCKDHANFHKLTNLIGLNVSTYELDSFSFTKEMREKVMSLMITDGKNKIEENLKKSRKNNKRRKILKSLNFFNPLRILFYILKAMWKLRPRGINSQIEDSE